jgi:hypothetical protein
METPPSDTSIFICGDRDPLPLTLKALEWASGGHPLRIIPTARIGLELARNLPPDSSTNT